MPDSCVLHFFRWKSFLPVEVRFRSRESFPKIPRRYSFALSRSTVAAAVLDFAGIAMGRADTLRAAGGPDGRDGGGGPRGGGTLLPAAAALLEMLSPVLLLDLLLLGGAA